MEDLKFNVKTIATLKGLSIAKLAKETGISYNHLREASAGRVKLSLKDGKLLSKFSGIPIEQIEDI